MTKTSIPSPFDWKRSSTAIGEQLQAEQSQKQKAAARIAKRRAAGDTSMNLHGVSKRADEILRMRKSLPVEGREAGQAAADRRGAALKARI